MCKCGQVVLVVAVMEGATLNSWTLGSQHEWSFAVWLSEGSDCGITEGSGGRWVCLLIAVEQASHLEQVC